MTQLLNQALRRKRDLLRLRQRARQLARALGYAARDQALIAASVFQLGCWALEQGHRCQITFRVADGQLLAVPVPGKVASSHDAADPNGVQLEWSLPRRDSGLTPVDVVWAMRELERLTPLDLFEEVRQQNADFLLALNDLQLCRNELGKGRRQCGDAA
jgi:hypothetical protein